MAVFLSHSRGGCWGEWQFLLLRGALCGWCGLWTIEPVEDPEPAAVSVGGLGCLAHLGYESCSPKACSVGGVDRRRVRDSPVLPDLHRAGWGSHSNAAPQRLYLSLPQE